MSMNLQSFGTQPYFLMQQGKLDVQAKQFIQQFDTDLDGSLSQAELKKSTGLLGPVQTKVSSPDLAQALWASVAGPTNTINAKEYASFLLIVDADQNGMITQAEASRFVREADQVLRKAGLQNGVKDIYTSMALNSKQAGSDQVFGTTQEEQFALDETSEKPTVGEEVTPLSDEDFEALLNYVPSLTKLDLLTYSTAKEGESPDQKLQSIKLAKEDILNETDVLKTLIDDLEPETSSSNNAWNKLNFLYIPQTDLLFREFVARQFSHQVNQEVANQGVGNKTNPELEVFRAKVQPIIEKIVEEMATESPRSPKYNALLNKIQEIDQAEYALYIKANPEVAQIVKEISAKNKKAIEDKTWKLQDEFYSIVPKTFSRISERQDIQRGKARSFQLLLMEQSQAKLNQKLDEVRKELKDFSFNSESPTTQSMTLRLTILEKSKELLARKKKLIESELKQTKQPFTEPSAEMKQYLELAKTLEPESPEYNKAMAKVNELAQKHYNLDGSNPSPLPATNTPSTTSTTSPASDDIDLPLV